MQCLTRQYRCSAQVSNEDVVMSTLQLRYTKYFQAIVVWDTKAGYLDPGHLFLFSVRSQIQNYFRLMIKKYKHNSIGAGQESLSGFPSFME